MHKSRSSLLEKFRKNELLLQYFRRNSKFCLPHQRVTFVILFTFSHFQFRLSKSFQDEVFALRREISLHDNFAGFLNNIRIQRFSLNTYISGFDQNTTICDILVLRKYCELNFLFAFLFQHCFFTNEFHNFCVLVKKLYSAAF